MGACYSFLRPLIDPNIQHGQRSSSAVDPNRDPTERTPLLATNDGNPQLGSPKISHQESALDRQKELTNIVTHMGSNLIDVTSVAQPEVVHSGKHSTDYVQLFSALDEKHGDRRLSVTTIKSSFSATAATNVELPQDQKDWLAQLAESASKAMAADFDIKCSESLFVTFD